MESCVTVEAGGRITVDGVSYDVAAAGPGTFRVTSKSGQWLVFAVAHDDRIWVGCDGIADRLGVRPSSQKARRRTDQSGATLTAPMPATVVRVHVTAGQRVHTGDLLVSLEAMKMELPVRAPSSGVVRAVRCREGDLVQPDVPLLEIQ
jgi:biotin carboxyl carrier protein